MLLNRSRRKMIGEMREKHRALESELARYRADVTALNNELEDARGSRYVSLRVCMYLHARAGG